MKHAITKERISITIDKTIYKEIKGHCDKHLIKISTYIEFVLKEHEKEKS